MNQQHLILLWNTGAETRSAYNYGIKALKQHDI